MLTLSKKWKKSFLTMLLSVIVMGFSLSLLVLTHWGTDPFSAMNYGVAKLLGLSFGTYQLVLNLFLLLLIVLFYRSVIGWGTLGNMVLVGYTADFFAFIWHDLLSVPNRLPAAVCAAILIPGLILFVISAACYMNSGQGMSPYDALPFILDDTAAKLSKNRKSHFKIFRYTQDILCTLIGFVAGGEVGAVTICMVLLLAPTVQYVGQLFQKHQKGQS